MPGGSKTGPIGMGPRTGRAAGYCAGSETPGYATEGAGRGFGGGFGRHGGSSGIGRGRRSMFYATGVPGRGRFGGDPGTAAFGPIAAYSNPDSELERQTLRNQADALKTKMDYINKRLEELDSE